MMRPTRPDRAPLVLHVLPARLRRGAQRYADDLVGQLERDGSAFRHELCFLFGPDRASDDRGRSPRPSSRLRSAGFDPSALLHLRRELVARRPAIVVAHGGEPLKYVALGATGVPIVYLKIGLAAPAATRHVRRYWHRWLVRRSDAVVGVSSEVVAEAVAAFGAAESSVRVIPNGRDPDIFRSDADRTMHDPPVVVFVGHMTRTKRPQMFLDVLARLQEMGVAARGRMIGDGDLLDEVRERGRAMGVEVLGGRDDVATQLATADLFLFTSVPEGEGMPGVLIEAAMCGLPIVTTRVAGAGDVVVHGRTGLIVDAEGANEVDELARACADALSDRDRVSRMGAEGSARARECFSLGAGASRWEGLFLDLCPDARHTGTRP